MIDKSAAPQFDVGPAGSVLNVYRLRPGCDEPAASFTPRSLREHEHDTLQVSVLLRGSAAEVGWHSGGAATRRRGVRGGQTYIIPANQPHDFTLHRPQGMVNFHIATNALVALDPAQFEPRPQVLQELRVTCDPVTAGVAVGVHQASLSPDALTPLYLDAAWTLLALHLARPLRESAAGEVSRLPPRKLRRVMACIEERLGDPKLRVADLAREADLSPVHFTRLFARATGATPLQYVIGRRIERACALLLGDHDSVAQVAFAAGFSSHAHMAHIFKRLVGRTPSQFRTDRPDAAEVRLPSERVV